MSERGRRERETEREERRDRQTDRRQKLKE